MPKMQKVKRLTVLAGIKTSYEGQEELRAMRIHKFKINQSVELVARDLQSRTSRRFAIVRPLPTEHDVLQYRIKSLTDGHERIVTESEIA